MPWLSGLQETQPIAHAIALVASVCVAGMALGSVKFRGVGLGPGGVLFAGLLIGRFEGGIDHDVLDFLKEFGLILFVFTIGLQLGPGFLAALRSQGLRLNLLALAIVVLGAVGAPLAGWIAGFDPAAVVGIFSGASTNTPSLGASTQALGEMSGVSPEQRALPALAYAVTYPGAILGIIASMLLIKAVFRIDARAEAAEFVTRGRQASEHVERRTLVIDNPNLDGIALGEVPGRTETGVTLSRLRRGEETVVATDATVVHVGDRIAAVGTPAGLAAFERIVGHRGDEDLLISARGIAYRRVVVTERAVLGKTLGQLRLDQRFGVAVTRVTRADLEMTAIRGLRLQFGDKLQIVGAEENLEAASQALGNSMHELDETHFIPLFIGILLGIGLGTLPLALPGIPQPVRLGLAGGPLVVALILGRIGRIGSQVWHMPENTNLAFREFGIALFFAAVGLGAGNAFFETVVSATGLRWLAAGFLVTVLPILLVSAAARIFWRVNFMDLCGLLAGSMTDPPALAFATNLAGSNAPSVAYATVYPLTTLLRILSAQVLVLLLLG